MALFISSRAKFLMRFEPHGDGFLYRDTFYSRAIVVSAEERHWMIADFNTWNDLAWIHVLAAFVFAALGAVVCSQNEALQPYCRAAFWIIFLAVIFELAFLSQRRRSAFRRGKSYADTGLQRVEVQRRERDSTSWGRIFWMLTFNYFYIRNLAIGSEQGATRAALACGAALAVAYTLWMAYLKIRCMLIRE